MRGKPKVLRKAEVPHNEMDFFAIMNLNSV